MSSFPGARGQVRGTCTSWAAAGPGRLAMTLPVPVRSPPPCSRRCLIRSHPAASGRVIPFGTRIAPLGCRDAGRIFTHLGLGSSPPCSSHTSATSLARPPHPARSQLQILGGGTFSAHVLRTSAAEVNQLDAFPSGHTALSRRLPGTVAALPTWKIASRSPSPSDHLRHGLPGHDAVDLREWPGCLGADGGCGLRGAGLRGGCAAQSLPVLAPSGHSTERPIASPSRKVGGPA